MKINKKGQGLPLTTIIIAAVGLIVLVVMVAIFTGKMGKTGAEIDKAQQVSCAEACVASGFSQGGNEKSGDQCNEGETSILFRGDACCCRAST